MTTDGSGRPDVELRLPAQSAYVAVLRMTTARLAADADFTLDDIEDLRIAVGEACAMVLDRADPDGSLFCAFELGERQMRINLAARPVESGPIEPHGWAWAVLAAVTADVQTESTSDRVAITLTVKSETLV